MRGIGEIQSPLGMSTESKTAALSQAGIYTVGQFGNQVSWEKLWLHKYKTVQLAMAKLNMDNKSIKESCGSVTFKLIERVEPLELKSASDMKTFACLLCGAMKQAMESVH